MLNLQLKNLVVRPCLDLHFTRKELFGWLVEGSCEVRRPQIAAVASRNIQGHSAAALAGQSDLSQRQAVLEGVTQMQTTSMHTPARRGGALVRTVRAVGKWFSRSVNALGQPYANADADRWFDWPRFPPF